ncbi:MAG: STAS domain-containing protein [Firmicutes bacterium]|nr:STAS domain-containing protein [Bacillota bacterium]
MLNIIKKEEEGKLLFELEGRLDTITAPDLEKDLMSSLEGISGLLLDFEKLEYISSAGLRVLLSAHKATAGKTEMKIVHVNDIIMEIFETTGFSDILDIE